VVRTDVIHEARKPDDRQLTAVRRLYESTIDRATRIPWEWMAGGLGQRRTGRDRWWPHLLVAPPDGPPHGFAYGSFLPGYAGYACYLGVSPAVRGRGLGTALLEGLFTAFRGDAHDLVEPFPFGIWESHRPEPGDGPAAAANWRARLRLFEKVGGHWIDGVDFRVPNYMDRDGPPVRLELFVKPFDVPAEQFDAVALRAVVAGLHRRVYSERPGDELYERAQDPAREPLLRPAAEAA
jgi:GNAT superfamily N-acetyltransferase